LQAISGAAEQAHVRLTAAPAMTEEAIQTRVEAASLEAASALSQLAAEHATHMERARIEAVATIQTAVATAHASAHGRSESLERIATSLADAETMPLAQDVLSQLQSATQHASQTQAHVSAIITRLESLATRAEEARVQLGERVIAAAQAADVINERLSHANTPPGVAGAQASQRELLALLHQAQVTGTQLHQLGAWLTHLLQAGEGLVQRLEQTQRLEQMRRVQHSPRPY
jgi:hypothetical protein